MDEPHAVVKLLVARMQSHPEEFKRENRDYHDRWSEIISDIIEYGADVDRKAMDEVLRDIRLGETHERAMEELLNGPERRRKQQEDIEYERQLIMQKAMAQRNTTAPTTSQMAQQYNSQYGNAFPQSLGTAGTWIEDTYNTTRSSITNTTSVANALQLGSEKLDETLLKKLKKATGL
jgi:hypothetical protein